MNQTSTKSNETINNITPFLYQIRVTYIFTYVCKHARVCVLPGQSNTQVDVHVT